MALVSGARAESPAADAINALGLDLLAEAAPPGQTTLLSPYSIQFALAMTYAGAEGETREQMARVLHYPQEGLADSFVALQADLSRIETATRKLAEHRNGEGKTDSVVLRTANRLFGQEGFALRPAYLDLMKTKFGAPMETMDFARNVAAAKRINAWVEKQTGDRIKDLVPADALNMDTRLVLVNAIYLKAPWEKPFEKEATRPQPFHLDRGKTVDVPTMRMVDDLGYEKRDGFTVVGLPYLGGDLQFVIFLPDAPDGLAAIEKKLTPPILAGAAKLPHREVELLLPRFKLEPPLFALGGALRKLGMKSAFNIPPGSANFNGMAPRKPGGELAISDVFHKTFLELDEQGTEAAAATAVVMARLSLPVGTPPKPVEVKVDRPFVFAVQHVPTGACLFLGRVTDPR